MLATNPHGDGSLNTELRKVPNCRGPTTIRPSAGREEAGGSLCTSSQAPRSVSTVTEVVRVRAHAVAELAADQRWRSKLYAGLALGAGLSLAALVVLIAVSGLPSQHGDDYVDEIAGVVVFVAIAGGLITFGVQRLLYARHLTRIELRAQTQPEIDWILLGREVRTTDPTGTGGPPAVLQVSGRVRDQLLRERT